jgi:prevent-host-death family protein
MIVRSERRYAMSTINVTTARSNLYRLIDQVSEESRPVRIAGQRSTAVLVSEEDWEAIQETLYLQAIPGMVDSIRQAREESVEAASEELDW